MRIYVLVIFFLGIIMTIIGHYQSNQTPKGKIVYRFIDKTIEEAQKSDQESVYNLFAPLFVDPPILI